MRRILFAGWLLYHRWQLHRRIRRMLPFWPARTCWEHAGMVQRFALATVAETRAERDVFAAAVHADLAALPTTEGVEA